MDITPTPAFNEVVRQVLGVKALIPGPRITIPAMQNDATASKIRTRHALILDSPAGRKADEMAAETKRKLDNDSYNLSAHNRSIIVNSEWKSWFEEEDDNGNGPIEVVSAEHTSTSQFVPDSRGEMVKVVTWREGDDDCHDGPAKLRADADCCRAD